eukprot:gene16227-22393_t
MINIPEDKWLWLFLEPFSTELWVTFFATSVVVALIIFLVELSWEGARQAVQQPLHALPHYSNIQWGSSFLMLHGGFQLAPRSPQGRIVALGYAFVVMILLNMYISSMASILTTRAARTHIMSVHDLAFQPTGIFIQDWKTLTNEPRSLYNLANESWNNDADGKSMLAKLRNGVYKALLLDAVWVDYTAATTCDLYTVGDLLMPVNLGFVYPQDLEDSYILNLDFAVSQLEDAGVVAELTNQYMKPTVLEQTQVGKGDSSSCIPVSSSALSDSSTLNSKSEARMIAPAATTDEALQELDANLRDVDMYIKHLPFVMAATFNNKLIELRHNLLDGLAVKQKQGTSQGQRSVDSIPAPTSGTNATPAPGGLQVRFPMLACSEYSNDSVAIHLIEQRHQKEQLAAKMATKTSKENLARDSQVLGLPASSSDEDVNKDENKDKPPSAS